MALIVQKFGGTSVADPKARACLAEKVARERQRGNAVVVVVSAMGRVGAPYATDTLLGLVQDASGGSAALVRDLIASCGETISACVVATSLDGLGFPAMPMTAHSAGIRATGPFGDAEPVGANVPRIQALLAAGTIPVITGFQALDPHGEIVTLGRGGSDTSAVAIGAFLKADFVDIFTDVPGVALADPRIVPEAPFLKSLDYRSMYRLASNGARVLHDRSAVIGERYGVKIRIRSTFDEGEGTFVGAVEQAESIPTLIGIALSKDRPESSRVTAIFRPGMASSLASTARAAATTSGAIVEIALDPDVAAFRCPTNEACELVRTLFFALRS